MKINYMDWAQFPLLVKKIFFNDIFNKHNLIEQNKLYLLYKFELINLVFFFILYNFPLLLLHFYLQ